MALNGLSHIVTADLAQHLAADIIGMMNHSRPAVRKKAILVFHSIVQRYPEALDQGWHRLQEKLEDDDPGVVSATVNVVCELARLQPRKCLPLSPQLFSLLTTSTNNWMLIKIVKLFGSLTPHEPRLVRRLLPPIKGIISTTPALSLLYECIHSVISGEMLNGSEGDELASACVDKLATFLEDEDRNLRYISLLALLRLLPTHPHLVAQYQESVLSSIDDLDLSIRLRALDLLVGMASRRSVKAIIERLLSHVDPSTNEKKPQHTSAAAHLRRALAGRPVAPISDSGHSSLASVSYRSEVMKAILAMGEANLFANIDDFEWYINVLMRVSRMPGTKNGAQLSRQVIDLTARYESSRPFAVAEMVKVLEEESRVSYRSNDDKDLMHAAAWVCGEYWEFVENPRIIIPLLLRPSLSTCSTLTAATCIHNGVKLFAHWAASLSDKWNADCLEEVKNMAALVVERLPAYAQSPNCEVSERADSFLQLFDFVMRDLESYKETSADKKTTSPTSKESPIIPPPADETAATWGDSAETTEGAQSSQVKVRRGPKSLHLLEPLFSPAPLFALTDSATANVVPPSSLDLHANIAPADVVVVEAEQARAKKSKKGTGDRSKEDSSKSGTRKDRGSAQLSINDHTTKLVDTSVVKQDDENSAFAQQKEERLRRQRHDPFYIGSKKTQKSKSKSKAARAAAEESNNDDDDDDVDSVPIVQLNLDDLPGLSSQTNVATSSTRSHSASHNGDAGRSAQHSLSESSAQPRAGNSTNDTDSSAKTKSKKADKNKGKTKKRRAAGIVLD